MRKKGRKEGRSTTLRLSNVVFFSTDSCVCCQSIDEGWHETHVECQVRPTVIFFRLLFLTVVVGFFDCASHTVKWNIGFFASQCAGTEFVTQRKKERKNKGEAEHCTLIDIATTTTTLIHSLLLYSIILLCVIE